MVWPFAPFFSCLIFFAARGLRDFPIINAYQMAVLKTAGLSKRYQDNLALDRLNLEISQGEVFCLLGQNGAGKTTTLHLALGFITPSEGQVEVMGKRVDARDAGFKKHVAFIPEVVQLYGTLTGLENLDYFSRLAGFRYDSSALSAWLEKAGLDPKDHQKRLSGYSKGMRQKVGIAIALAKHADLVLMDEPTSGLDPKATANFIALCKLLAAEGKSILMATHDLFSAVSMATRIGIMKEGRLVHVLNAGDISADDLQKIYLETI
jgi:ABC-2 type transport system ATP-binding protein